MAQSENFCWLRLTRLNQIPPLFLVLVLNFELLLFFNLKFLLTFQKHFSKNFVLPPFMIDHFGILLHFSLHSLLLQVVAHLLRTLALIITQTLHTLLNFHALRFLRLLLLHVLLHLRFLLPYTLNSLHSFHDLHFIQPLMYFLHYLLLTPIHVYFYCHFILPQQSVLDVLILSCLLLNSITLLLDSIPSLPIYLSLPNYLLQSPSYVHSQ